MTSPAPVPPGIPPHAVQAASATPAVSETRCRACSAPLEAGKLFCSRCGTPTASAPTCPHCGAVADVSPHDEVRIVCNACGAPRIEVDRPGFALQPATIDALRRAERARVRRRRWRIAGAFGGVGAVGILGLALLVQLLLGFSAVGTAFAVLLALPLAIVAMLSIARSKSGSTEVATAIDEAWVAAARQLTQQSDRPLTTAEIGAALRLSEPATERLAAQLAVDQLVDTDVTADGQLAFGSGMRFEQPAALPNAYGAPVAPAMAVAPGATAVPAVATAPAIAAAPGMAVAPAATGAPPAADDRARIAYAPTLSVDPTAAVDMAEEAPGPEPVAHAVVGGKPGQG